MSRWAVFTLTRVPGTAEGGCGPSQRYAELTRYEAEDMPPGAIDITLEAGGLFPQASGLGHPGFDLYAPEERVIMAGCTERVSLAVRVRLPCGKLRNTQEFTPVKP